MWFPLGCIAFVALVSVGRRRTRIRALALASVGYILLPSRKAVNGVAIPLASGPSPQPNAGTRGRRRSDTMALTAGDQVEISKLVARYADAVSRADPSQWAATWAQDSTWHLRSSTVTGRDQIVETWKSLLPAYDSIVQIVSQGWAEDDPAGARGRWLILEILRRPGADHDAMQVTCYTDRYVQEDGRWLFAERGLVVHYARQLSPGEFYPWGYAAPVPAAAS
jgi:uncharacterized protein (TIGR02246 family)